MENLLEALCIYLLPKFYFKLVITGVQDRVERLQTAADATLLMGAILGFSGADVGLFALLVCPTPKTVAIACSQDIEAHPLRLILRFPITINYGNETLKIHLLKAYAIVSDGNLGLPGDLKNSHF
ncbi:hypothetical protein IAQ61_006998 [Plenodomus lingam]|uniref:uncharacterized protein n=1 Tax=Leptosphaeria maculans TaxID=5022 RepID=UPI00332F1873|nr:hypothetical protein IAQ61_006998 [Plenodomus lingam]